MYSVYKELHPPTVIDHAIQCYFFGDDEVNLVTAGASRVNVYRLYSDNESSEKKLHQGSGFGQPRAKKKLEQVAEYALFGNVMNMHAVRLGNNSRDSLLLSFRDAKLSLVEYDPSTHDLKTNSLHLFENEEFKKGLSQSIHPPLVRVDPEHRCACMLVYGGHLVIIPFKHEMTLEEAELLDESEHTKSVLPSYMIDISTLEQPVANVIDLQFLHGYHEPTLMLLFEPVQTCSGRVAVRQDTYCVAAISLNMKEKVHPIIWNVNHLPFDCFMLKSIEKPLGGVLVFGNNALIYLSQSTPPYGVSLNSMTASSTMFPLMNQENVVITLAEAVCDFVNPERLIISLKGGELYVLTLLTDGLRSVRSFHFDKAAGSVLASCICHVDEGFVFLGSRLGNSLLLRYTERGGLIPGVSVKEEELDQPPSNKKMRIDSSDDFDDLEIFGDSGAQALDAVPNYSFDVSDSILSIGPIAKCAVGEPSFLSEEFVTGKRHDLELVCCSGFGKNGALSVLQRSIRPQVVTTFELPGCLDMWTVYSGEKEDGKEHYHSFLILSRDDSTMVLKTSDEITEIDQSGFYAQYPTVFAGNLGNNKYILQVCPMSVRLLEGDKEVQDIPVDTGSSAIAYASVADPHVMLLCVDGSVIYMYLQEDLNGPGASLQLERPSIDKSSKIVTVSLYKDLSGLFATELSENVPESREQCTPASVPTTPVARKPSLKEIISVEDEDELLYGGSSLVQDEEQVEIHLANIRKPSLQLPSMRSKDASFWCIICRETGGMEIYSIPDFKLVFVANSFNNAPKVVVDGGSVINALPSIPQESVAQVKEVLMHGFGHRQKRPLLFVLIDQDLVIYECFPFVKRRVEGHLPVRFKRLELSLLMRVKEEAKLAQMAERTTERKIKVPALRIVRDVAGYSGVFVCGAYPHWLFVTDRGVVHGHPMTIDGAVNSFASFNNVNCPRGFFYFNKLGELRIAVLPTHLTYDSPWPVRKVPLRMTPYDIAYAHDAKVYAVAVAFNETHKKLPRFHTEEREFDTVEREARFIYPQVDRFIIQLISPVSWEVIPNTRTTLNEFEHVTCMKMLSLNCEVMESGEKPFLVVGTTYNYGEDLACKGRVLIFDILEVVPEPGKPLTKTKYKCLHDEEQKGPVTAISACSGYLIVACGQKIYAYHFRNNSELVGVAFVDAQVFTVSLVTMKNIIFAADIKRSVSLMRFQVNHKALAHVSRDTKPLEACSGEFFVDGPSLGFLVSDVEQNIIIFAYQPEALESFGGQRLLQKADFNAGCHINCMFRVTVIQEDLSVGRVTDKRQATYMPSLDGGISLVLPISEKSYRRLLTLQTKLVDCLQHRAGLNPRAFRALHVPQRPLTNPSRNILDGTLLSKYIQLSFHERYELAKKMGTTPSQILDDMMDAERATAHF